VYAVSQIAAGKVNEIQHCNESNMAMLFIHRRLEMEYLMWYDDTRSQYNRALQGIPQITNIESRVWLSSSSVNARQKWPRACMNYNYKGWL
jgi:hypothetical protein